MAVKTKIVNISETGQTAVFSPKDIGSLRKQKGSLNLSHFLAPLKKIHKLKNGFHGLNQFIFFS